MLSDVVMIACEWIDVEMRDEESGFLPLTLRNPGL
jgi:hypothetical protein